MFNTIFWRIFVINILIFAFSFIIANFTKIKLLLFSNTWRVFLLCWPLETTPINCRWLFMVQWLMKIYISVLVFFSLRKFVLILNYNTFHYYFFLINWFKFYFMTSTSVTHLWIDYFRMKEWYIQNEIKLNFPLFFMFHFNKKKICKKCY